MRHQVKRCALDEEAISQSLRNSYWRVKVLDEVTSTQTLMRESNPSHGSVFTAEYQSQGRGRLDRTFHSPKFSGLLSSIYIEPSFSTKLWGWIPLLVGMTVAQVLNEITNTVKFQTKWPNDVIAPGGKVCGILCETFRSGVIIGIGINVSTQLDELPVESASSIYLETENSIDRNVLLASILARLSENLARWEAGKSFEVSYRELSATLGREISAHLPDGSVLMSKAVGISPDGGLLLESGEAITVGDIVHLR
jgi:BirA family transcriptional regulator, biotin operon repressor / biotin---[acetyl-CoA-carboxylase] ligase